MSSSSLPATWLPFDDLIEQLNRKGFRIGVEHNVRLQALLDRLGDQCAPLDLKTLLCPLFATNAQQQQIFYRAFDTCYPFLHAGNDDVGAASSVQKRPAARRPPAWRKWILLIALIAISLATALTVAKLRTRLAESPRAVASPPSVTRPTSIDPTRTPAWVAGYTARRTELVWIVAIGPLALWLGWELYRYRQRQLLIRKSLDKAPPYSWPVRADAAPEIYPPSELVAVSRLLHRRYQGEAERLDVMGTIDASIASLGFPTFRYRRDSRLPEYLCLIDRAGFRDHQAHFYTHLAEALRGQGLYVSTWFYDGDPRVCWGAESVGSAYLEQLARSYPGHRLLLFGTGDALLDPVTGNLVAWHRTFETWADRALLTPEPPSRWDMRELTLATQFGVVPATLDGLRTLAAYFDSSIATGQSPRDSDGATELAPHVAAEIAALRSYLGPDVFQWLCACAIYPELQWWLTLRIGALPSMPPGLIREENLTKLVRLEWFRTGSIPDDRRRELIAQLDRAVERDVREAIVHVLEESAEPEETVAARAHGFQIAYQRAWLAPRDGKARADLRAALDELSAHEPITDHAYIYASRTMSRSPLDVVLPQRVRKLFYPAGLPWMGLRVSANLAATLTVMALGLYGLRLADRLALSPVFTIERPIGGTIVGSGIECGTRGSRCSTSLPAGTPMELVTIPDRGYVFTGFTGDCAPTGRTALDQSRTCGATFAQVAAAPAPTFRLTIAKPRGGTIFAAGGILCGTRGGDCSADLPWGVPVSLKAEADDGFSLHQFSGDCPSNGEMTMTSSKTCGALFVQAAAATNEAPRALPPAVSAGSSAQPGPGTISPTAKSLPSAPILTAEEHAKLEISELVKNYCLAFESLNARAVGALFHHDDNEPERAAHFREYKSLKCTQTSPLLYDRVDAGPAGAAQLKFGMTQQVEIGSGPRMTVDMTVTMVVSRRAFQSPWLIDRVSHEPKTK